MRHIYRMYKFVKLISDSIKSYQKLHPEVANTKSHFHPEVKEIVDRYSEMYGLNYNTAQDVCRDVIDSEWIDKQSAQKGGKEVGIFCTNRKTRQLVEGIPYFRIGLINEWMKEFGSTFTILIAVIALIVSVVALTVE